MKAGKDKTGRAGTEFEQCSRILERETGLLEKITSVQIMVRNAVMNREWADFELLLKSLGDFDAEFETLEAERARIFSGLVRKNGGEDAGFYALAARFPAEERKNLTELYRRLKMEAFKIRLANDTLLQYLNEARNTVAAFLEAAFPDRKGRIYSREGVQIQADMRSMVLDRSL
jgi:hypothetical protein